MAKNKQDVFDILDSIGGITTVLSGEAIGPDRWGRDWAITVGVPVDKYIPDWKSYGKSAGMRRNEEMVQSADRLIAFHDGITSGTKHVIRYAKRMGLEVIEYVNELDDGVR